MSDNEWEYDSEGYCSGDDSWEVEQRRLERDNWDAQYEDEHYESPKKIGQKDRSEEDKAKAEKQDTAEKDVEKGMSLLTLGIKFDTESKGLDLSSDMKIIEELIKFCEKRKISTEGVLFITFQKNRTTQFSTLIVDFEKRETLPVYPQAEDVLPYKEFMVKDFSICYSANLKRPVVSATAVPTVCESPPFCCSDIIPYKPTVLQSANENVFKALLNKRGNFPAIVFQVKRQINNRPKMVTQYFMLKDDTITEVFVEFNNKVHAFKNYICKKHDLFFGIDLFKTTDEVGYNYHHMRLNPFLKINVKLLTDVFQAC